MYYIYFMGTFDTQLRKITASKNIDAKVICQDIGVREGTFSRWMNGKMKPGANNLNKLAQYFKVPINYFFEDQESVNNDNNPNEERRSDYKKPGMLKIITSASELPDSKRKILAEFIDVCTSDMKSEDGGNNDPILKEK